MTCVSRRHGGRRRLRLNAPTPVGGEKNRLGPVWEPLWVGGSSPLRATCAVHPGVVTGVGRSQSKEGAPGGVVDRLRDCSEGGWSGACCPYSSIRG